jgi:hypothetical protein
MDTCAQGVIALMTPTIYSVGDRVRWSKAQFHKYQGAEGIIIRIVHITALPEFTLYDVRFEFGTHTLLAEQIELVKKPG